MKERNIDPKKFEPRSILAGISNAKMNCYLRINMRRKLQLLIHMKN